MDMDLDELDQAVTKLMDQPKGKRSIKKPASPIVAAPMKPVVPADDNSVTVNVTPKVATVPEPKPVAPESHSIPVNRPMPKVPERKRTHPGAMDIIQPTTPKTMPPSARPTREATALQPTGPVKPEPVVSAPSPIPTSPPSTDVSDEVLASLGIDTKTPTADTKPVSHEKWPDPLDFHDFAEDKKEKQPEQPPSMGSTKSEEPSQSTPFLTTKVEKRPLGAYADADAPVKPQEVPPKSELAQASIGSNQHAAVDEPDHNMNELRQMAIPPQYQTADRDKKEEVHNVYDTKEYHAPPQMMPAAHKASSPWLTVSIFVLIVLIVAALAVGYFMMTGTVDITKLW